MRNWNCYVELPADKLPDAIRAAYALSEPRGLGFLHAQSGPLDDETVNEILDRGNGWAAASMDYVRGRCCKFTVYRDGERLFVLPRWYDHSNDDLVALLTGIGVTDPQAKIDAAIAEQEIKNAKPDPD